ncbi:hypothetical protein [Staphylococcus epidermidis]|uniref:hypothetical protein n=1 Tax=Staphylococcus epidermidis TaxID=1282 RepID=UPI00164343C6|nr:hypothetical protein [Staphylococcus epidermidis]
MEGWSVGRRMGWVKELGRTGKNREWLRREWNCGEMEVEWIGVGSEVVKENKKW